MTLIFDLDIDFENSPLLQPERISGDEYTIRSDVWSTGISLLELVQNRFPFPNDLPPIELMMYITAGEVRICGSGWCHSDYYELTASSTGR